MIIIKLQSLPLWLFVTFLKTKFRLTLSLLYLLDIVEVARFLAILLFKHKIYIWFIIDLLIGLISVNITLSPKIKALSFLLFRKQFGMQFPLNILYLPFPRLHTLHNTVSDLPQATRLALRRLLLNLLRLKLFGQLDPFDGVYAHVVRRVYGGTIEEFVQLLKAVNVALDGGRLTHYVQRHLLR